MAGITVVQTITSTSTSAVLSAAPSVGDCLIVGTGETSGTPTTPTGGGVGTWVLVDNAQGGSTAFAWMWYGFVTGTPSATISNLKGGGLSFVIDATDIAASPIDGTPATATGTTSVNIGTITPSATDLIVVIWGSRNSITNTPSSGTVLGSTGSSGIGCYILSASPFTPGTINSGSSAPEMAAVGAAFLPVSAPTSAPRHSNTAVMRAANYMKRASGLLAPRERERIVIPQLVLAR